MRHFTPNNSQLRVCASPECNKEFRAFNAEINRGRGKFCSFTCSNQVTMNNRSKLAKKRRAACHPDKKYHAKGLCKQCYHDAYSKSYYLANKTQIDKYQRSWYADNRDKMRAYHRKWNKEQGAKRREDRRLDKARQLATPQGLLTNRLRSRMAQAIKNNQKVGSAVDDLGCSISTFKLFIENQFEDGMSWENHGEWHLDHVMPLSSFDLGDRQQFLDAVNWLNYQPLWATDNLSKGAKVG